MKICVVLRNGNLPLLGFTITIINNTFTEILLHINSIYPLRSFSISHLTHSQLMVISCVFPHSSACDHTSDKIHSETSCAEIQSR